MLFGWFDTREARAFGAALARTFIDQVPLEGKLTDKKFEHKAKASISNIGRQVAEHNQRRRLNFLQKASLGNSFKWTLKDAGYEQAYVDKLTDWLVLQL
jgi:hypothetical protein